MVVNLQPRNSHLKFISIGKFSFQNLSAAAKISKLLQKRVPATKLRNLHCEYATRVSVPRLPPCQAAKLQTKYDTGKIALDSIIYLNSNQFNTPNFCLDAFKV